MNDLKMTTTTTDMTAMTDCDAEANNIINTPALDIEHLPVRDDPRAWSPFRKNVILFLVCAGSMIAGFTSNIQNPAIAEMEEDLPATADQISLSISLFILLQGAAPLMWSAFSEVYGRKVVYLSSLSIFVVGSIAVAVSKNIASVIGCRILQAVGSSAVMNIGATTLADLFEPEVRGKKMGIYYMAPLLGPSLGSIFGGILTTGFNWRACFWFLVILAGCVLIGFIVFFRDTFRLERSMVYQRKLRHMLKDPERQDVVITKLTFRDVSPFKPIVHVLRRLNNAIILASSGMFFAFNFMVVYTSSRTLGDRYGYNPLRIGLVLISYGVGSIMGSVIGGRYSDSMLARQVEHEPEMRLKSTYIGLVILPFTIVGLGWTCEEHVHIAAVCVMLFLSGFFSIWAYTSTLAYIVDANVGRSSTAVASNSLFRGTAAFVGTEIAVPVQDGLGDGWFYTIFAGVMVFAGLLIVLVEKKGGEWRRKAEDREGMFMSAARTPVGERAMSPIVEETEAEKSKSGTS